MKKIACLLAVLLLGQVVSAQTLKTGKITNIKRLTNGITRYERPQWSPNGKLISLTSEGCDGIYVMNNDGSNFITLSTDVGIGYMPQWSADSKEILVRDTRWIQTPTGEDRVHAAWVINLKGVKKRVTQDVNIMQPAAWKYTSTGAKTVSANGIKTISASYEKNIDMSKVKISDINTANISFIVDGDYLYVVDAAGNKRLVHEGRPFCPALSPNGKMVVFNNVDDVMVMNIDGSNKRKLARGFNATWANDTQIIYERTNDNGHEYTAGELYILNINGGSEKAITATNNMIERQPVVSPDGSKLLFISDNDGQLYQADLK